MSASFEKLIANIVPRPEDNRSFMEKLALLPREEQEKILDEIAAKCLHGYEEIPYLWKLNGRPNQFAPEGKWSTLVLNWGRGSGKELSLDTDIFTKNRGWIKWGELHVGDILFTETGTTTSVTHVHPVTYPDKCYRLYFSDGSTIEASGSHRWATWSYEDRMSYARTKGIVKGRYPKEWIRWKKVPRQGPIISEEKFKNLKDLLFQNVSYSSITSQLSLSYKSIDRYAQLSIYPKFFNISEVPDGRIKTTEELKNSLYIGENRANHTIPNTLPLEFEYKNLSIPPYLYGLFLGDGDSNGGGFSIHSDDFQEISGYIQNLGFQVSELKRYDNEHPNSGSFTVYGLSKLLRENNLLRNKHIISDYLYSSVEQRLDFLRGLLDTDGSNGSDGCTVYFYNTNLEFIKAVYWLITSLGMHGNITSRKNYHNGKEGKLIYRVRFSATLPVFKLQRKLNKIHFNKPHFIERTHRTLVKIEEIPSIPMNCITVDSPNESYLVTKSLICSINTRTASEWIREKVDAAGENNSPIRIALVAPTANIVNKVIVKGDSGLLSVFPPWDKPEWVPTNNEIRFKNGSIAYCFSAEDSDRIRGNQCHYAWMEEFCTMKDPGEMLTQLELGLRLGKHPQMIVTTTPLPIKPYLELLKNPSTIAVLGSTFDNKSNLPASFLEQTVNKHIGTRTYEQEIFGAILVDTPGALWTREIIEKNRIPLSQIDRLPQFLSVVVAVDPAMTENKTSAQTGICVAAYGADEHFYILHLEGLKVSAEIWSERVLELYDRFMADKIVCEMNNGGKLVTAIMRQKRPHANIHEVFASQGKTARATPIANLYERGLIHHVGYFEEGEEQMMNFSVETIKDPKFLKDVCFAPGTLITTEFGDVPIEEVKVGDKVLTRQGFKKVIQSQLTSSSETIEEIRLSNGRMLFVTENHPIFVRDIGFIPVKYLPVGAILESCEENELTKKEKKLNLMGTSFIDILKVLMSPIVDIMQVARQGLKVSFIERFINFILEKFLKDIMSIIKMGTIIITLPIIWSVCLLKNTIRNIQKNYLLEGLRQNLWPTWESFDLLLLNGMEVMQARNGIVKMPKKYIKREFLWRERVFSVKHHTLLWEGGRVIDSVPSSVETNTQKIIKPIGRKRFALFVKKLFSIINTKLKKEKKPVRLTVLGKSSAGISPVYNLKVAEVPEYYANGVLVHNCDSLVWATTSLVEQADKSKFEMPEVGGIRQKLVNYRPR